MTEVVGHVTGGRVHVTEVVGHVTGGRVHVTEVVGHVTGGRVQTLTCATFLVAAKGEPVHDHCTVSPAWMMR